MTAHEPRIRVLLLDQMDPESGRLPESSHAERLVAAIPLVELTVCATVPETLGTLVAEGPFDVLMVDLSAIGATSADLGRLQSAQQALPIILLAARAEEDLALAFMQAGAHDYLLHEEMDIDATTRAIRYALSIARLQRRVQELDRHLEIANCRLRELFLPTSERVLSGPTKRPRTAIKG